MEMNIYFNKEEKDIYNTVVMKIIIDSSQLQQEAGGMMVGGLCTQSSYHCPR